MVTLALYSSEYIRTHSNRSRKLDESDATLTYLAERVADVVDRLPLELEPVHLEHLVARPQLAAPLGRASFHHATDDHALSLIPDRRTLQIGSEID